MKFTVRILLFLFIFFLSTPTIISLIEKNHDVSIYIDSEESKEKIEEFKELKASISTNLNFVFEVHIASLLSNSFSNNQTKHDDFLEEIFSPPPELT